MTTRRSLSSFAATLLAALMMAACATHTVVTPAPAGVYAPTAGPAVTTAIVGHATSDSLSFSIRGAEAGETHLVLIAEDGGASHPVSAITDPDWDNHATVRFDGLDSGATYRLVARNGEVARGRTLADSPERLRFVVGSCMDHKRETVQEQVGGERPRVVNHQIWEHLVQEEADAFFLIGDRFYLPYGYEDYEGMSDGDFRTMIMEYHQGMMSVPGVAEFLSRTPTYVTYDDHDMGPNDVASDFRFRDLALEAIERTYANPAMGTESTPGAFFRVSFPELDAFVLDCRYHRDCANRVMERADGTTYHFCRPETEKQEDGTYLARPMLEQMYGPGQLAWLKEGLQSSSARVKLVIGGGQHLSDNHGWEAWYHFRERERFLSWLNETKVPGVVFVAGDRHTGEIGVMRTGGVPYPLWEITSSGLGVNTYGADEEGAGAKYRVVGEVAGIHHYGAIEYHPEDGGTIVFELIDRTGRVVNRQEVRVPELTAEETATRWFRGNTHAHTTESDGDSTPDEVASWYRSHGYDFLVLSDHNVLTSIEGLAALEGADGSFLLIRGEEVSDVFGKKPIHVNGLGLERLVPPQGGTSVASVIQRNVDAVRSAKGVPHINHPNFGWAITAEDLAQVERYRLLEIFNGHPLVNNEGGGESPSVEAVWDVLLSAGKVVYGIAVDDAHHFKRPWDHGAAHPGRGWIVVRAAELEAGAILEAMERGDFYASTGVVVDDIVVDETSMTITIAAKGDTRYTTSFIGLNGVVLARDASVRPSYTFRGDETYVRAKIVDSNGNTGWLQPHWPGGVRTASPAGSSPHSESEQK
jgi:hypothetical protein